MNAKDFSIIAKAIKNADAHGFPCTIAAMRMIKLDIAESVGIDMDEKEFDKFLDQCGLNEAAK